MASILLTCLFTFSLFSLTSPISDETITDAAEVLSNSGYNAMSLTLPLVGKTLISTFPSAPLFSPTDHSFSLLLSGQPSFSLLQFHFCPRFYSFADLQSLSFGSQIPTLLFNHSLTFTASIFDEQVSINGVKILGSPLFDDGFLAIFGIDGFLNPNFRIGTATTTTTTSSSPIESPFFSPTPISACPASSRGSGSYGYASSALRSRGYSLMAGFLDLQLTQFGNNDDDKAVITVFAPDDVAMERNFLNYSDWGSVFLRHVVPCELSWADMVGLNDGFVLTTFLDGFVINVNHSGDTLMLNGKIPVDFPDFYRSNRISIHGLREILDLPTKSDERAKMDRGAGAYSPETGWMNPEIDLDHGEFSRLRNCSHRLHFGRFQLLVLLLSQLVLVLYLLD